MKKTLITLFAIFALTACGNDDEPNVDDSLEKESAEVAAKLNGTFAASWESLGLTQYEVFVFTPYEKPQKTEINIPGEYVNKDKTVTIYGRCIHTSFYNDHLSEVAKDYLYSVEIPYNGATPRLIVYTNNNGIIHGNWHTYDLRNVTSSSFEMDYSGSYRDFVKQ